MTMNKRNGANLGFENKLWQMAKRAHPLEAEITKNLEVLEYGE